MPRFILPVQGTLTQPFGANPSYYAQFGQKGHNGLDYGNKLNTPVYASGDGTINFEGWGQNNSLMGSVAGICVIIDHGDVMTGYAHLASTVINKGQAVRQGQIIGYMGATGTATGVHTHFEFIGKPVNTSNGYYGRVNPDNYLNQSGGDMADKVTSDTWRILSHGILGRNGLSGRKSSLDGSMDNEGHIGRELTNAYVQELFLSSEGRQWRDSKDSNSINGINSRLSEVSTLQSTNANLTTQVGDLTNKNAYLTEQVNELLVENAELQKEVDEKPNEVVVQVPVEKIVVKEVNITDADRTFWDLIIAAINKLKEK